jgi:hypothetical protein
MSPARREMLRQVMTVAWKRWRFSRLGSVGHKAFAECLRGAWEHVKDEAAREANYARWAAAPVKRVMYLRSSTVSPIRRSLTGKPYANRLAWDAGRLTTTLGR